MIRLLPVVVATVTLALASPAAQATCLLECSAALMLPGCEASADGVWPADEPLTAAVSCQTCCSPPGGPLQCDPTPVDTATLSIWTDTGEVAGAFAPIDTVCDGVELFVFTPEAGASLAPGSYELRHTNMILVFFDVEAAPGCASDADCGPCSFCVAGACTPPGDAQCFVDSDCAPDELCEVDAATGCGVCVAGPTPCASDADCGGCSICIDGTCTPPYEVQCFKDTDCQEGEVCESLPGGEGGCGKCVPGPPVCTSDADCGGCSYCDDGTCTPPYEVQCFDDTDCPAGEVCEPLPGGDVGCGKCVPGPTECADDADCGACAVCVDGACMATGLVICVTDEDCEAGEVCQVNDPADPCANTCDPAPPGCVDDADCGACAVCIDGACMGTGDVACTEDADCAAGEVCQIDPDDPCANTCVQGPPECADDADCGACSVCFDGACMPTGDVACTTDADCGADDQVCQVDPDDPCANTCVSVQPPECTVDSDCGECGACHVDPGVCARTAEVVCTDREDCLPWEVCMIDPDDPCNNRCMQGSCVENGAPCGDCGVCVDNECVEPPVTCLDACGPGESCQPDPEDWCSSKCLPDPSVGGAREDPGCSGAPPSGALLAVALLLYLVAVRRRRAGEARS